jgi:hypothetical protein
MPESRPDSGPARSPAGRRAEPISYPLNHVVAIVDAPELAGAALHALTDGAFLESEVILTCGVEAADLLHATSGHSGLLDRVLQLADHLGVRNEELEERDEYEQALRRGEFVIRVLAPTEERKQRAAQLLREHGGHFITFQGRFTVEELG